MILHGENVNKAKFFHDFSRKLGNFLLKTTDRYIYIPVSQFYQMTIFRSLINVP